MIKRWITFIIGINVLAIGIILNTKSLLGVGSINTLPYSLSIILHLSLGTMTTITYVLFIIIQFILLKRIDIQVVMQLPFSFVFGFLIDFFDLFFNFKSPSIYLQFILLTFAIILTSLGAFLMIKGNIVLNPADGIVHTISQVSQKDFGFVKNVFDIVSIVLTSCICLITKGYIIGIGIGTILSAIFIGRCVTFYQNIDNQIIQKQGEKL